MSFATANRTRMSIVFETVAGVTPVTPVFQDYNYTGEDLNTNIETVTSETIRSDRMTADLIRTLTDVSGSLNFESQVKAYDALIEAALQGTWSNPIAFTGSLNVVAATRTVTDALAGGTAFANAAAYQWVKLGGFTNSVNNGWHQIESVTSADEIVLVTTTLVDETGSGDETADGTMLRNGVIARSMTVQKSFLDTTVPSYFYLRGSEISAYNLNAETGSILTGSFSFIGRSSEATETPIAGETHVDPSTNTILDAVNSLGNILKDGVPSTSTFQNLAISLDNNSRGQEAIGVAGYVGIAHGSITLTGSTGIYFESIDEFNDFNTGTPFSLSFTLSSVDGDVVVTIPRAKFSSLTIVAGGINTDIVADAEFTAIIDQNSQSMIQLDATAS